MTTPPWRVAGATAVQSPSPLFHPTPRSLLTHAGPGFHPVSVRKTLGKANNVSNGYTVRNQSRYRHPYPPKDTDRPHSQQNTQQQPAARRTQFPDALKAYVARTFEDCPAENKAEVEVSLKKIITDAFENGSVWTIDWATYPLPVAARKQQPSPADSPDKMDISSGDENVSPSKFKSVKQSGKRKLGSNPASEQLPRPDKKSKKVKPTSDYSYEGPDAFKRLDRKYKKHQAKNVFSQYNAMHSALDTPQFAPVVGRSTKLEKRYLRLTSAPDPDTVRPLHILERTLELLKSKWKAENNYSYICDQFKSLRQDLTVQHIKNDFTINVYEIHARIALEKADLGEYNQCQSQLANLYSERIPGGHPHEFKAYRILYLLHTCNRSDMNDILASLTPAEKQDHAILHALAVRSAVASGNFHRFFRLYLDAPNMGGYLMDSFIDRERLAALCTIVKSYRPDILLRHITEELGFENDAECEAFLVKHNAADFMKTKDNGKRVLETQKVAPIFEAAKAAAFKKVDIKGQI
ncbi:hypothetical protein ABW19_dt0201481 [Dactylella cylindrospora]|nr:hypothetical protein ABW19_dt0201481 [Dactylella cylindrospora]